MQMGNKIYELLDLLKTQQDTINKQNKMIAKLLNENVNIYGDKHGITKEMIEILKYYKENK